jgi:hypothetical protein
MITKERHALFRIVLVVDRSSTSVRGVAHFDPCLCPVCILKQLKCESEFARRNNIYDDCERRHYSALDNHHNYARPFTILTSETPNPKMPASPSMSHPGVSFLLALQCLEGRV